MKGYIVYPTYRIINDRAYIVLFGRLENGESFATATYLRPYFYIKVKDLKKAQLLENFEFEKTKLKTFDGKKVAKVILDLPSQVPYFRKLFESNDIECYEADIKFSTRFLIDNNILSSVEIEGDYTGTEKIGRVYQEPNIRPAEFYPELKVLSFDIETNEKGTKIYCISFYGSDSTKRSFIISDKKIKGAISCQDEEDLLIQFRDFIVEYDPDIITGWNVIDFDLKVIQKLAKKYHLSLDFGRDNTPPKLRIEKQYFRDSKADVPGRIVLDGLDLIKKISHGFDNYKLDTVASELLGDKKLIQFKDKGAEINGLYKDNPEKLVKYNLKDAELVIKILKKTKVLDLLLKKSFLTGLPLDRSYSSIAALDSLYLRETKKLGLVCNSVRSFTKDKSIKGGFVQEPLPGIYSYVIVLDFKSLYPSMIRTFNIDPASYTEKKTKDVITAPNGAMFKNSDGILPEIIRRLWAEREKARKNKDEAARYAIKILMNSFYGVLASPNCRFFNLKIANAITHFGQYLIKLTAEIVEDQGFNVIYADTDSNFIVTEAKTLEEAEKIGKKLEKQINEYYKKFIKEKYNRESHLEIEYEKCYTKLLLPKTRNTNTGAKKRYAGLLIKDGKEILDITGMEAIRSDWTEVAKHFQSELLWKTFHNTDIQELKKYIIMFIKELRSGKFDDQLVYKKYLRKNIEDYTKTTPPHVKAAKLIPKLDTNLIEYYITTNGPEPKGHLKHPIDYDHYVNKQIMPIADSILNLFGTTFKELTSNQKSLFQF